MKSADSGFFIICPLTVLKYATLPFPSRSLDKEDGTITLELDTLVYHVLPLTPNGKGKLKDPKTKQS